MMQRSVPRTESRRYYYSEQKSFEQSIDVWKPAEVPNNSSDPLPLVVLVVGSAWLGHRSIIYSGTSWWNSSGPRTFARKGCVCVCIRHRGAFPVLPEPHIVLCFLVAVTASVLSGWGIRVASITAGLLVTLVGLWALGASGSASYEDMLHDVADALVWVSDNKEKLTSGSLSSPPFVFGGYSSGGHVAAMLLQNPELLTSRGLPPPEKLCDAVLMVSAVLAVRHSTKEEPEKDAPRWCTNFVIEMVFGKTNAESLPSPLHGTLPRLPHVLIGCEKEVFGFNFLNLFFCSKKFAETLLRYGTPARYVEIKSDHWNVLNSSALACALDDELRWICKSNSPTRTVCVVCKKKFCAGGHAVAAASPRPEDVRQE